MKKIISLLACGTMFLTGCGVVSSSVSEKAASTSETTTQEEESYSSYITYTCDQSLSSKEIEETADILEKRFLEASLYDEYSSLSDEDIPKYDIKVDEEQKEITLRFDYIIIGVDNFLEVSALPNAVRFRKGDKNTDEVILTNSNISSAEMQYMASGSGSGGERNVVVLLKFDHDGTNLFAKATSELAGTGTPISIWCDDEMLYAPIVNDVIVTSSAIINGNFDSVTAQKLALRMSLTELPYKISVKEHKFAVPGNSGEEDTDA